MSHTINGLPYHEYAKKLAERSQKTYEKLCYRNAKIVDFNEEDYVEIEFTRDDGVRDRVVFKACLATGLTADRLEHFNRAQRSGIRNQIGRYRPASQPAKPPTQP